MTDVDVIVAGGGPVGLATAIGARLAGMSVAVVEPRAGAIDKACGEGLMPGAIAALAALGVDPPGQELVGIAYIDANRRVERMLPGGSARGVRRLALHATLAARADQLGIRTVRGRVASLASREREIVAQVVAPGDRRASEALSASWLVGCDGLHSDIRRLAGLEGHGTRRHAARFGLRRHYRVAPWSNLIEVHWAPAAELYVTPVAPDVVGVAVLGRRGVQLDDEIARVPALTARLAGADALSEVRGAGPLRQRVAARSRGRVLLAGDASGYVDALTGEGIRVGLAHASAAVDAMASGDSASYEREWRRSTREARMLTEGLLALSGSPLRRAIVPVAAARPGLFAAAVDRLAR